MSGKDWSADELRRLRELWVQPGLTRGDVSAIMGRSKDSLGGKARRLGLPLKAPTPAAAAAAISGAMPTEIQQRWVTRYWPRADLQVLLREYPLGTSLTDIGRKMGRSRESVSEKARSMGLPERVCHQGPHTVREVEISERAQSGPDPLPPGHPIALAAIGMTYREFISVR